jgi:alginate O-acetyltransferase complex protein AlgJ
MATVRAQDTEGIVGQNEWLFYGYELTDVGDSPGTQTSMGLIQQFNQLLQKKGIKLVITMVPIKMRLYAEHLPETIKLNEYMLSNYDRMNNALRAAGVSTVDLNTSFLNSPMRKSDTPLYFKLDTHWSTTGAMLAAETIEKTLLADSDIRKILDSVPTQAYKMTIGKNKRLSKARDILQLLPADSPAKKYAFDSFFQVTITRVEPVGADLLGKQGPIGVSLVGSSYSKDWSGFADALRFKLQKEIFSMGVGADQGSWTGMESYLRDEAFQQKPPKLLIWEIPERDMLAPPDYKYRNVRYSTSNTEWIKRVTALVNKAAQP